MASLADPGVDFSWEAHNGGLKALFRGPWPLKLKAL